MGIGKKSGKKCITQKNSKFRLVQSEEFLSSINMDPILSFTNRTECYRRLV